MSTTTSLTGCGCAGISTFVTVKFYFSIRAPIFFLEPRVLRGGSYLFDLLTADEVSLISTGSTFCDSFCDSYVFYVDTISL